MGDASDNIPGVPGIGPKTAQKLIAKFGSMESLLENTDQLKGKQKERVEENKDQAILSKELVTICLDVPHDIVLDDLKWSGFNKSKLKELFGELEFDTLGKRMLGKSFSAAPARQAAIRDKREKEIQSTLLDEEEVEEPELALVARRDPSLVPGYAPAAPLPRAAAVPVLAIFRLQPTGAAAVSDCVNTPATLLSGAKLINSKSSRP